MYDTLHMPVSKALQDQTNSFVVRSYPDSGYFMVWIDTRDNATNRTDIYAQKFDKDGVRLWQLNGVPVATGPDAQTFLYQTSGSIDIRHYNFACTDSAGGFFVVWDDDNSVNSGSSFRSRICAQHLLADGSSVFPGTGKVIVEPTSIDIGTHYYIFPQLVADGQKGFFVSFIKSDIGGDDHRVYVQGYSANAGNFINYGTGIMNFDPVQHETGAPCGSKSSVDYPATQVVDYFIYPDLQGGCNVVMSMQTHDEQFPSSFNSLVAFNKMCRIKKDAHVTVNRRSGSIADGTLFNYDYKKDSVVALYSPHTYSNTVSCSDINNNAYVYTNYYVENFGKGYLRVADSLYSISNCKAVLMPADRKININVLAGNQRTLLTSNTVSDFSTHAWYVVDEKYDSIPYQLCTDLTDPYFAYNVYPPAGLSSVASAFTTLLSGSNYFYDFALAGSGSNIFATAAISPAPKKIFLQQLKVTDAVGGVFKIDVSTGAPNGVLVGKEISTGSQVTNITYNDPIVTTDQQGNGLFCIIDKAAALTRLSPIGDGAQLLWGAMGVPINTGYYNSFRYSQEFPYPLQGPSDGTAVIAWDDNRNVGGTAQNIWMRHIDSIGKSNYEPPVLQVKALSDGASSALPAVISGSSMAWSTINSYNGATSIITPAVAILDDYDLGSVAIKTFENTGPIRTYNGKPYLDRNYLITPENSPQNDATIQVRLFFTQASFDALKAADPTILTPADLGVIKQPSTGNTIVTSYAPVAGETILVPTSWKAVNGGYYLEVAIKGFSNFFITKGLGVLPVTWLDVTAERYSTKEAKVTWQVAMEQNIKNYTVQSSLTGNAFSSACTVQAKGLAIATTYSCIMPADKSNSYYFRIAELDNDGRNIYSKTVMLQPSAAGEISISPNPAGAYTVLHLPAPKLVKSIVLYNSYGIAVWKIENNVLPYASVRIPLAALPAGSYYVSIVQDAGAKTFKVIKSN